MQIQPAVEQFILAYVRLQAATAAAELRAVAGLPCVHFSARLDGPVADEIILTGLGVEPAVERIRAAVPGLPHWLTVFTQDPAVDLEAALNLGYEKGQREYLMARGLEPGELPAAAGVGVQIGAEPDIWLDDSRETRLRRALPADTRRINAARRYAVFHPSQLADPDLEILWVERHGKVLAWGAGLLVGPDTVYIANMHTLSAHRRAGLARAILRQLLVSAAARGATRSILVSSQSGLRLYLQMGYRVLCDCLVLRKTFP